MNSSRNLQIVVQVTQEAHRSHEEIGYKSQNMLGILCLQKQLRLHFE